MNNELFDFEEKKIFGISYSWIILIAIILLFLFFSNKKDDDFESEC